MGRGSRLGSRPLDHVEIVIASNHSSTLITQTEAKELGVWGGIEKQRLEVQALSYSSPKSALDCSSKQKQRKSSHHHDCTMTIHHNHEEENKNHNNKIKPSHINNVQTQNTTIKKIRVTPNSSLLAQPSIPSTPRNSKS